MWRSLEVRALMEDNTRTNVIRVWSTSVIISPFIYALINPIPDGYNAITLVIAVMIFIGGFISIPCAILLELAIRFLTKFNLPIVAVKSWLSIIGLILCYSPFFILGNFRFYQADLYIAVPYGVTVLAAIWIYRLNFNRSD